MDEKSIIHHIDELVAEEHDLRHRSRELRAPDRARLQHLEDELDQAWDLLRRRRAAPDAGQDPDAVQERSIDEVESYLQ